MQSSLKGLSHNGAGDLTAATAVFNDAEAGEARGLGGEGCEGEGVGMFAMADLGGACLCKNFETS